MLLEPERLEPPAAVFLNERVSLLDRERLQSHRIAGEMPGEGEKLIPQHWDDKNEKEDDGQDENSEDEERRAEAVEPNR